MRQRNWRVIITGAVLAGIAVLFFLYMQSIASSSNDPQALMTTVGQVSGAVVGISLAMIIYGVIGRKA